MMDIPAVYREIWRRRISQGSRGYTAAHDDEHTDGSIADAAACYASPNAPIKLWPWRNPPPDHHDRRSHLIDAAALCIAEIERLDRAEPQSPKAQMSETTCYIERSKVREILIASDIDNENTRAVLQEVDALPIFTASDICDPVPSPTHRIGEYRADYSPLSAEEIAKPDPELAELYAGSRVRP